MTTYDALGLPTFATTDKIAADGDGLREDLNLISATASAAITAEAGKVKDDTAAKYPMLWKPDTDYKAAQRVVAPSGDVVAAKADHRSGASYTAANWTASSQDGRLGAVEAKQPVKCVRLESGAWIWDTAAGTHYVVPDVAGALIVRPTAEPVPAATPALNW